MAPKHDLTRYENNVTQLNPRLEDYFGQFLENFDIFNRGTGGNHRLTPHIDISESKASITLEAEIPGMKAEDFDIIVEDDLVRIRGEKKQKEKIDDDRYYRVERHYGRFERAVRLPAEVTDKKACALYKDGVLTISLPKKERSEQKTKRLEVKSS